MWFFELFTHMPAHAPLMLIAGIRRILCVACKCVCHYWEGENLQLHRNNMPGFSQSEAFVQIESSTCKHVWRVCDKNTLVCFAAIFRSTPIWRITAVVAGGNFLLDTYRCALNLLLEGWMCCTLDQIHDNAEQREHKIEEREEAFFLQVIKPFVLLNSGCRLYT